MKNYEMPGDFYKSAKISSAKKVIYLPNRARFNDKNTFETHFARKCVSVIFRHSALLG